jgi:hypothetical protein
MKVPLPNTNPLALWTPIALGERVATTICNCLPHPYSIQLVVLAHQIHLHCAAATHLRQQFLVHIYSNIP